MYAGSKHWRLIRGFLLTTMCEVGLQKEQFTVVAESRNRKIVESDLDWVESHLL